MSSFSIIAHHDACEKKLIEHSSITKNTLHSRQKILEGVHQGSEIIQKARGKHR